MTSHTAAGHSPAKLVDSFPENVPAIFVTSKKDVSVPAEGTIKLAHALADKKKNDVYLLVLENSCHTWYVSDDPKDSQNYLSLVHTAYKHYGMAHIPEYVNEELMQKCKL